MTAAKFILLTHEFAPFRGGAATYAEELANALHRADAPVEVWAPDYSLPPSPENQPLPIVRLPSGGSLKLRHLAQLSRDLASRQPQMQSSTVILASVGAHLAAMLLASLGQLRCERFISLLHGSEILRFERNPFWRVLAPPLFRRVKTVATVSAFSKSLLEKSFLSPLLGNIHLAPCAGTTAAARVVTPPPRTDDKFRVLTLARLHPRKGQLDTAHALGRLPAELRRKIIYQVGGVGGVSYLRQIENSCHETSVAFEYLGAIASENLAATYAGCDIFAMTSRTLPRSVEGFGIAYLDAGFHGKPVVAYRTGGVAEAVLDGKTGLLVDEGDLDALAKTFTRLLLDENLRVRLGTAGRHHAQQFTWDKTARVFLQIPV